MKSSKFTYLLVMGLALTVAVAGCRKKPTTHTTIIPYGGRTGAPGDNNNPPPGPPVDTTGVGITTSPGGGSGIPIFTTDRSTWKHDAQTLETQTVYFDYDSAVIKTAEKTKIEMVASHLKANSTQAVSVEGHCDERGTEEYNRSLGQRRALAVREVLIGLGIAPERVDAISFGKDRPADTGHTKAAWAKNRRDAFVLLSPQ